MRMKLEGVQKPMKATAATKHPTPKQLKNAQQTLKKASKAKLEAAEGKLKGLIDTAMAIHNGIESERKIVDAQIAKLEQQKQSLQDKFQTKRTKGAAKIVKMMKRLTTAESQVGALGGTLSMPDELAAYNDAPEDIES